ncbi:hypothetical protein SLS54_010770 [Diplodia seriata]
MASLRDDGDPTMDVGNLVLQVKISDPPQVISILAREASLPHWKDELTLPVDVLSYDELVSALKRRVRHEPRLTIETIELRAFINRTGTMHPVRRTNDLIGVVCEAVSEFRPRLVLQVELVLQPLVDRTQQSHLRILEGGTISQPEDPITHQLLAIHQAATKPLSHQSHVNLVAFKRFFFRSEDNGWPSTMHGPEHQTRITGLKVPLPQYQLFGIWWALEQLLGRPQYGVIIGDELALGRTPIALGMWIISSLLMKNYAAVELSRKNNTRQHNKEGSENAKCPSRWEEQYGSKPKYKHSIGIITTWESYHEQVEQVLSTSGKQYSMVLVDDFDEDPHGDGGPAAKITDLDFRTLLLLSGNPYGSGKGDVSGWFPLILRTRGVSQRPPDFDDRERLLKKIEDAAEAYFTSLDHVRDVSKDSKQTIDKAMGTFREKSAILAALLKPYLIRRKKSARWVSGTN